MRDATFQRSTPRVTTQGKRERRLVLVAGVASLFLHVVIALSVAAFSSSTASLRPLEAQPVQLTMVDLPDAPTPTPRVNPQYMETDRESAEQPKEKTFESNANSIAASEQPVSGEAALPSQEGREAPFMDLQTQQSSVPSKGSTPQPTPPPVSTPAATPVPTTPPPKQTPVPSATPAPTATPPPSATPEPEK